MGEQARNAEQQKTSNISKKVTGPFWFFIFSPISIKIVFRLNFWQKEMYLLCVCVLCHIIENNLLPKTKLNALENV